MREDERPRMPGRIVRSGALGSDCSNTRRHVTRIIQTVNSRFRGKLRFWGGFLLLGADSAPAYPLRHFGFACNHPRRRRLLFGNGDGAV